MTHIKLVTNELIANSVCINIFILKHLYVFSNTGYLYFCCHGHRNCHKIAVEIGHTFPYKMIMFRENIFDGIMLVNLKIHNVLSETIDFLFH